MFFFLPVLSYKTMNIYNFQCTAVYTSIPIYVDIVDISNYNKHQKAEVQFTHQLSLWSPSLPGLAVCSNVLVF